MANKAGSQSSILETRRREDQLPKVVFRSPNVCHGMNATLPPPHPPFIKKNSSLSGIRRRGRVSTFVSSLEMMLRTAQAEMLTGRQLLHFAGAEPVY